MEILGGGISRGRVFTPAERRTGAPVIIVEQRTVDRLFGPLDPVNRLIKVGGRPFRVIGAHQRPTNIFELPGAPEIAGIVPFETARRNFKFDEVNGLIILVRPVDGVGVPRAMDAVTLQLRRMRGIRVGEPNSFDLLTSDQVLSVFDGLTAAFFLVMLVLSSIALMVGGIGVMAIMMVSVTDRTREIGLRKAVGATRREILWQFLVEAATLTLMGGVIGIVFGLAAGEVLKSLLRFSTTVPLWSAAVARPRGRARAGDPPARRDSALPHRPAPGPSHRLRAGARRLLPGRARQVRRRGRSPPALQGSVCARVP